MKIALALCFIIFAAVAVQAQTTQPNADSIAAKLTLKQKLSGKSCYFVGAEKFHTRSKPDSTQKNDALVLNEDMTYTQVEDGKPHHGMWSLNEAYKTLNLTDAATRTTQSLKVATVVDKQLVLSFKDANLVTYYKFYLIKDK